MVDVSGQWFGLGKNILFLLAFAGVTAPVLRR
jgi:hypothetical protein